MTARERRCAARLLARRLAAYDLVRIEHHGEVCTLTISVDGSLVRTTLSRGERLMAWPALDVAEEDADELLPPPCNDDHRPGPHAA